jgi:hypothetical protein
MMRHFIQNEKMCLLSFQNFGELVSVLLADDYEMVCEGRF